MPRAFLVKKKTNVFSRPWIDSPLLYEHDDNKHCIAADVMMSGAVSAASKLPTRPAALTPPPHPPPPTLPPQHLPPYAPTSLWSDQRATAASRTPKDNMAAPSSAFQPVGADKRHKDFMIASLLHTQPHGLPSQPVANPMCDLLRWDLYYKLLGYDDRASVLPSTDVRVSPYGNAQARFYAGDVPQPPVACFQRPVDGFAKMLPTSVAHAMTSFPAPPGATLHAGPMFRGHEQPKFPSVNAMSPNMGVWNFSAHGILALTSSGGRKPSDPTKPPPVKKYKCDVCSKCFSRSNTLVTHKRIHTGDKPFTCDQCGRAFRQPGNLTRHRLTHTTIKPYVCPQCSKAFNRASNLHTHMRTHTNYRPFLCQYCGKGFHQKIDMKIHSYTHTGEKPHKCKKCGRGFKQLTHLTYHMRTHSDVKQYTCEYCGKGFNQKGNMQAHIYSHTGERPYKCETCGKGFTLASTLNTHRRTHADVKPFSCQHCSKEFYHKNALKSHLLASHPYTGTNIL